ncbi:MAG: endolytic peptidoglycan transglycosylase RlpA [Ewingella americana]|jgi:rare lipoprotein A|uniref:endolytic peptidoglycan transglycosylase RlpA n=1 Tax=Ewingella americana TaxID=41202 RepID=UPI00242EB338|nr:endolytic peptidoglycan transglycosylase RlpA [Ewingella americana]MCI1676817.1 endolytic peptidoglycan transglycosylase RlpA [Ewingella americana]MCI1853593.1 endolytic peptidoglycan transglycosylase RlpA [Ewingella americana]MCI1860166.1 endolytic peptidoglycan transglycosylase RlpA [Ewingella americana]MCI2144396.1 endolytic peptidoglycan transglycosylase RlpA [Ewingella americana]MCI2164427.1 endolytic peptidoglycan transglycosylase RlpA [Ewingella americana]
MRKQWLGAVIIGLLLSACSTEDTQQQQPAPPQTYNGPVVEIGGADPRYEPYNPGTSQDYSVNGKTYKIIKDPSNFSQVGLASWYGQENGSNTTAIGEEFDPNALTAAHPTLPIPSYVRVTNVANGRMLVVRVNDRGPYTPGRIIDLSQAAAERLNLTNSTKVRIDFINVAPDGTLSGPGTIGTTVAKQSYALPARPELGASGIGTPVQSAPTDTGAAVRPIDNSTLTNSEDTDTAATTSAAGNGGGNGGGFLQAPKPVPQGILEHDDPAPIASPSPAPAMAAVAAPAAVAAASAPRAASSSHAAGGSYMVQVGALSNPQNAALWQKSLSQKFSVPGKVQPNGSMYRVQLGPLSRQQAEQLKQRLASEAQQQSFVVSAL